MGLARALLFCSMLSYLLSLILPGFAIEHQPYQGLTLYPAPHVSSSGMFILLLGWLQMLISIGDIKYLGGVSWLANLTVFSCWMLFLVGKYRISAVCALLSIAIGYICVLIPNTIIPYSFSFEAHEGEMTQITSWQIGYDVWTYGFYFAMSAAMLAAFAVWFARHSRAVALRKFE